MSADRLLVCELAYKVNAVQMMTFKRIILVALSLSNVKVKDERGQQQQVSFLGQLLVW